MPGTATPDDLARLDLEEEQAYLDHARRCLAAMREATERLKAQGGDEIADEILAASILRRIRALHDDPNLPLFFGRIDHRAAAFHIGRRHVHDAHRDPVVVDWRAEIATPFYRATRTDPMGIERRRRFGFRAGSITALEDELLALGQQIEGLSRLVAEEIERPRTGPMRDIVATIQPDQDEIVRAGLDRSVCVQGGPGTGKTAVGLHRVAYLIYAHAEQLRRSGVLVIGPNDAFLGYIAQVLPALGEFDVEQRPLDEVLRPVTVRRDEDPTATLKHDARMAEVIRRAVASNLAPVRERLAIIVLHRTVALDPKALTAIRAEVVARGLPYEAGRKIFRERVSERLLRRAERLSESAERSDVRRGLRDPTAARVLDDAWPKLDPVRVLFGLLSDERQLDRAADGILEPDERRRLLWEGRVTRAKAPWSRADRVLIDEVAGCLERPGSFGHLVVDEAQDRSPMELRAIGRRAQGSVTLLGDLAQATTPWASRSWEEALAHLGIGDVHFEYLTRAFRIPASVLELANRLLPLLHVAVPVPVAVRDATDALTVVRVEADGVVDAVARHAAAAAERQGSTGVIVPAGLFDACGLAMTARGLAWSGVEGVGSGGTLTLLRPGETKGLEFDDVVLAEPWSIVEGDPATGLNTLYVAITRTVMRLMVISSRESPSLGF